MKKKTPSVWLCAALLVLALIWRMLGAPVTAEQLAGIKTPLWQARILLPSRAARMLRLWFPAPQALSETMTDEVYGTELPTDAQPVWLNVYVTQEERFARMTLDGYVCGVVAAEIPAAYHMEALKAQAVAARTRVVQQLEQGGCALHPGADICTDSAHCQGYATLSACREMWGGGYEAYRDRILQAQQETQGQILTYEGQPITVLYHAISGGRTENAQTVFSQNLPYLVSVESRGEETARGFQQDTVYTYEQIAQMVASSFGAQLTSDQVRRTLAIGSYTQTGRVQTMLLGGVSYDGADFRRALDLRSTWFSISMDDEGVTFHQRGYGHGVGMSQAGANSMAASGSTCDQILLHYYPGTSLQRWMLE